MALTRRGFFGMVGAVLAAPFLPKVSPPRVRKPHALESDAVVKAWQRKLAREALDVDVILSGRPIRFVRGSDTHGVVVVEPYDSAHVRWDAATERLVGA